MPDGTVQSGKTAKQAKPDGTKGIVITGLVGGTLCAFIGGGAIYSIVNQNAGSAGVYGGFFIAAFVLTLAFMLSWLVPTDPTPAPETAGSTPDSTTPTD